MWNDSVEVKEVLSSIAFNTNVLKVHQQISPR